MTAGKPVAIRIEWEPNAGYMAFVHNGPLPAPDRHSLWMTPDVAHGVDYYVTLAGSVDGSFARYRPLTGQPTLMPTRPYGLRRLPPQPETPDSRHGSREGKRVTSTESTGARRL